MKVARCLFDRFVTDSLSILSAAFAGGTPMIFKNRKELTIMQKFFISIVVVGAMLTLSSCNNEPIDKQSNSSKAIVFDNVQTKAGVSGVVDDADKILRMGVFAQMNLGDIEKGEDGSNSYVMLLENENVWRDDVVAPWTYEHTRYWVTDRVYHFFAVWPYSGECDSITNVSKIQSDEAYGYSVTFDTPAAADQELLTARATQQTKSGEEFPESVRLTFKHELTNVNLKIWSNGAPDNVQDKIKVKRVSIKNITKKGTLSTYVDGSSSWKYSSEKLNEIVKDYGDDGITVSQAQIIDNQLVPNEVSEYNSSKDNPGIPFGDGLLLVPQTITEGSPVIVTVIYDLQRPIDQEENVWEEKKLQVLLPATTWPAGKKLTYNLVLSGERTITEFQLNTIVDDWTPQTEYIDFSEQVVVNEDQKMQWVEGTYESINPERGEVVLYTDVDKVAVCNFNISQPAGATWTASLIPLTASAMDAFSIVEDSKYGEVGTPRTQQVKIRINNPDPISARNACLLRITVQTPDGRTIVVKNLLPDRIEMPDGTFVYLNEGVEEFTIIQNLING